MSTKRSLFWSGLVFFAFAAFELVADVLWFTTRFGVRPTLLSVSTGAVLLAVGIVFLVRWKRLER